MSSTDTLFTRCLLGIPDVCHALEPLSRRGGNVASHIVLHLGGWCGHKLPDPMKWPWHISFGRSWCASLRVLPVGMWGEVDGLGQS